MKKTQIIEDINKILPLLNLVLLVAIVVLGYMFVLKKEEEKVINSKKEEQKSLVIFVVEDKVFNKVIQNKQIEVLDLAPLRLKILNNGLQIEKDGQWQKWENKNVIIIYRETPKPQGIKGEKIDK